MISIIAAIDRNWGIGYKGDLLCELPDDLKQFKKITIGHPIIMGRKTFESLPHILPDRHHFVLTRDRKYTVVDNRVTIIHSLEDFLASLDAEEEYFVIGGGDIYRQTLPYAQRLYLTILDEIFIADTFFPNLAHAGLTAKWVITKQQAGIVDSKNPVAHQFVTFERVEGE